MINPSYIEYVCFSKLRTLLHFWRYKIKIPRTVYVPCNPRENRIDGSNINFEKDIADLIQQELSDKDIVIKPDAGTHGKKVLLVNGRESLLAILGEIHPSIINPVGIIAQELIKKWFYDLRIIVVKECGKMPYCYPRALARAGFKDFRTNTYLGNMVFGVNLPQYIRDVAVKCGEAIGKNCETWVLAFDAMLNIGDNKIVNDEYVRSELEKLMPLFNAVKKVKGERMKKRDFLSWNKRLEEAFQRYMSSEAYENVKRIIEESIKKNKYNIVFHEANSCPEFWEQTRLVAGINLAMSLLRCAQSIMNRL